MIASPAEAVYASLEGAERIVFSHAISEGYTLSRSRFKKCRSGEIRKFWLVCANAGRYKTRQEYLTDESWKRRRLTRSCKRRFTVTIKRETVFNDDDNDHTTNCSDCNSVAVFQWSLAVKNSDHNHEAADDISAYPAARKISLHNAKAISAMARAGAAPKVILATALQIDPSCNLIPRNIYNTKAVVRENILLEEHLWRCCYMNVRQMTFSMLKTATP